MNLLIVGSSTLTDKKEVLMEALQESDQTPTKLMTTPSIKNLVSLVAKELKIPYHVTEEFDHTCSYKESNLQIIRSSDYVIFLIDENDPLCESYRELLFECMNNGKCFVTKIIKSKTGLAKKYYIESNKRKTERQ